MTEKEIKNFWGEISDKYQTEHSIHTKSAHYGPGVPDENKLGLLGNVKGKRILELGCGGAQCSIAFAKQGAIAAGIDISKEQLEFARHLVKENKVNVNLILGSFQDIKKLKSNYYDIVFSAFAFIMFIWAGFLFLMAKGDPAKILLARQATIYGMIGVAVGLLAFSIPLIVKFALGI